ncbi:ATP synthase F(1) complex subunit epsilon, mitochondrial-like [Dermatophagoides farinae]|uniref:ATP synthase F(1) complex subunit epsilon, mitochondrial-like n=1 Tax=Dermatophagoides farinae TaxID=6954 RepID=UPI003F5DCB47
MSYWRSAGITYLRYSAIAARQVRESLKKEFRRDPMVETMTIKRSDKKLATQAVAK